MGKGAKEIIINLKSKRPRIIKKVDYGDAFVTDDDILIVTQVTPEKHLLISLDDGNRYLDDNIIGMKVYEVAELLRESYEYEDISTKRTEIQFIKNYSIEVKGESVIV